MKKAKAMTMEKIIAEDGILVNGRLYFVSRKIPVLFEMDCTSNDISCAGILYKEEISLSQSSRKIVRWNDELVIVPYNARHIYIYNLRTKKMSIVEGYDFGRYGYLYIEAFAFNNKVIMVGAFAMNIIELDMMTRTLLVRNTLFERFTNAKDLFCRSGFVIVKNNLFLGLAVSNSILKINLESWESELVDVGNKVNRFSGIAFDGNNFWLSSRRGKKVFVWDGNKGWDSITMPFEAEEEICNFGGIYFFDDKIWLHGFEGGCSAIIDPIDRRIIEQNPRRYYFFRGVNNEGIVAQDLKCTVHLIRKDEDRKYCFEISDEMLMKIKMLFGYTQIFGNQGITGETSVYGLKELIGTVVKKECKNER